MNNSFNITKIQSSDKYSMIKLIIKQNALYLLAGFAQLLQQFFIKD